MGDHARRLLDMWHELERQGAVVHRVPLDSSDDVLRARCAHESRRLRALAERDLP